MKITEIKDEQSSVLGNQKQTIQMPSQSIINHDVQPVITKGTKETQNEIEVQTNEADGNLDSCLDASKPDKKLLVDQTLDSENIQTETQIASNILSNQDEIELLPLVDSEIKIKEIANDEKTEILQLLKESKTTNSEVIESKDINTENGTFCKVNLNSKISTATETSKLKESTTEDSIIDPSITIMIYSFYTYLLLCALHLCSSTFIAHLSLSNNAYFPPYAISITLVSLIFSAYSFFSEDTSPKNHYYRMLGFMAGLVYYYAFLALKYFLVKKSEISLH